MGRDLSEMVLRKFEAPGRARVRAVNRETGLREIGEGVNRHEAKLRAYALLAHKEGKTGAAIAFLAGAEQAKQEYFEKLKVGEAMLFDDEPPPWGDDVAFMRQTNGNQ